MSLVYGLLIVPAGEEPYLLTFETLNNLVTELKNLDGTDTCVFPFYGEPYSIGKAKHGGKYLVCPNSNKIALFDENDALEISPTGYLGDP